MLLFFHLSPLLYRFWSFLILQENNNMQRLKKTSETVVWMWNEIFQDNIFWCSSKYLFISLINRINKTQNIYNVGKDLKLDYQLVAVHRMLGFRFWTSRTNQNNENPKTLQPLLSWFGSIRLYRFVGHSQRFHH